MCLVSQSTSSSLLLYGPWYMRSGLTNFVLWRELEKWRCLQISQLEKYCDLSADQQLSPSSRTLLFLSTV